MAAAVCGLSFVHSFIHSFVSFRSLVGLGIGKTEKLYVRQNEKKENSLASYVRGVLRIVIPLHLIAVFQADWSLMIFGFKKATTSTCVRFALPNESK